jgi:hypothetical protein
LSNKEKIELLEDFKKKTWFSKDAFKDRDMDWPGDHVVEEMRLDVLDFTNFLIHKLNADTADLQSASQAYFDAWENAFFTQDETEFLVEIEYEAMRIAGLNIDKLII